MEGRALHIDLNCDLGESTHERPMPEQEALFPYLTSCNIACGFHGGDPIFIEKAIRLALQHGLRIGAHPSYPDRAYFGRRDMELPADELRAVIRYQVAALSGMVESLGGQLAYVKPHGALYNRMAYEHAVAEPVLEAVLSLGAGLKLMGLAGSPLADWARQAGLDFIPEAFADRRYTADGRLASRSLGRAVIEQPAEAVQQAHAIITGGAIRTLNGAPIRLQARSLCLHGDHPQALQIAQALDEHFSEQGIQKRAL